VDISKTRPDLGAVPLRYGQSFGQRMPARQPLLAPGVTTDNRARVIR